MFHPYKKNSSYLRAAVFSSYGEKCLYCGRTILQRDMHIDHIVPAKPASIHDEEICKYLSELEAGGFIVDSVENYAPSCPACNIQKSNYVYPVATLRFYHEQARRHVSDILKRIKALEGEKRESFYEPTDPQVWEELDFAYQHSIAPAIMGYRLTPADVKACPRFPQVEQIIKQLNIVDYVTVQGETGCGKSISVYQAAYDMYQKGWKVYRYKATEDFNVPVIPHNTERSLYIIDDAQRLSERAIEALTEQARPNTKILLAKTVSSHIQHDSILLTNRDAVRILYNSFLSRKEEIQPIVHQYDRNIGINLGESPIEKRLKTASDSKTPWQFNYTLRGGWQTMKAQYQAIQSHRDCDLLAASIALFQITQLDNSVNYPWLCGYLQCFDNSLCWTNDDLQFLIDKRVVISSDDVRIVHLESAYVIVAQFLQNSSQEKERTFRLALETATTEKRVGPRGLVWLCNGLLGHTNLYRYEEVLISQTMVSSILELLKEIGTSQERYDITLFMEKTFAKHYKKNGFWYFKQNESLLLDWISHANSVTAYAYSLLVNTLYNTDEKQHRQFVLQIDWIQILQSLMQESTPNLYAWGQLLNRLTFSLSDCERAPIAIALHSVIELLYSRATVSNIAGLSGFMCSVVHLDRTHIHETLRKLTPVYSAYFKKDMAEAIYLLDFDFLMHICGMSLLWGHRTTQEERETAARLVAVLPEKEIATTISNSLPRNWQSIHRIMRLVSLYDRKKAKHIIRSTDIAKLSSTAKDCWEQSYEITDLCVALQIGDKKTARSFIECNEDRIQVMYSSLALIAPQCAVRLFAKGVFVDLLSNHWWDIGVYALKEIIKIDKTVAKGILQSNIPGIIKRLNNICEIDFEDRGILDFLQLTAELDADTFDQIDDALDMKRISTRWQSLHIPSKERKRAEKRYSQLLKLIQK